MRKVTWHTLRPTIMAVSARYQWGTTPLAMHGVVIKKNGETVKISIGEQEGDPVFCVSDLLPHLAAKQNERKLS